MIQKAFTIQGKADSMLWPWTVWQDELFYYEQTVLLNLWKSEA